MLAPGMLFYINDLKFSQKRLDRPRLLGSFKRALEGFRVLTLSTTEKSRLG